MIDPAVLLGVDLTLQGVGLFAGIAYIARLIRSRRWRNPLAEVRVTGDAPTLERFVILTLMYMALTLLLSVALPGPSDRQAREAVARDAVTASESTAASALASASAPAALTSRAPLDYAHPAAAASLHRVVAADHTARLIACVGIFVLVRQTRLFASPAPPLSVARWGMLALGAALFIVAITTLQHYLITWLLELLYPGLRPPSHPVMDAFRSDPFAPWGQLHLAAQAALVAPLVEEIYLRGFMLPVLWRFVGSRWIAILITSVLFGVLHLGVPTSVIPLISMGVVLGYLRIRYQSVTLCVVVHILFNLRTMVGLWLAPELIPT